MQLPEQGQKWGFLIWLIFSYSGLCCIAFFCVGKVCLQALYLLEFYYTAILAFLLFFNVAVRSFTFLLILFSCEQWLTRRQAHMLRAHQGGVPVSEYRVIISACSISSPKQNMCSLVDSMDNVVC